MSRSELLTGLVWLLAAFAGCSGAPSVPLKIIATSPDGNSQVLSVAQATKPTTWPTSTVAQAAYHEPVAEVLQVKPFRQWSEQDAAAEALGRIGPAAVPALVEALQSADPAVRFKATEVLGRMGSDAQAAVPELVPLLDDRDEQVRKAATRTIGRIGPPAQEAVPALVRTLLQPDR